MLLSHVETIGKYIAQANGLIMKMLKIEGLSARSAQWLSQWQING